MKNSAEFMLKTKGPGFNREKFCSELVVDALGSLKATNVVA